MRTLSILACSFFVAAAYFLSTVGAASAHAGHAEHDQGAETAGGVGGAGWLGVVGIIGVAGLVFWLSKRGDAAESSAKGVIETPALVRRQTPAKAPERP